MNDNVTDREDPTSAARQLNSSSSSASGEQRRADHHGEADAIHRSVDVAGGTEYGRVDLQAPQAGLELSSARRLSSVTFDVFVCGSFSITSMKPAWFAFVPVTRASPMSGW